MSHGTQHRDRSLDDSKFLTHTTCVPFSPTLALEEPMRSLAQACTLVAFAVAVASVTVTPTVAAPAPAPENTRIIFVNLTCGAAGHFHARCTYSVSGGTAPYTYS